MCHEHVIHTHSKIYSWVKKNKIMELAEKWVDLETVTLSKQLRLRKTNTALTFHRHVQDFIFLMCTYAGVGVDIGHEARKGP